MQDLWARFKECHQWRYLMDKSKETQDSLVNNLLASDPMKDASSMRYTQGRIAGLREFQAMVDEFVKNEEIDNARNQ